MSDSSAHAETILWRRLDRPGHEAARLVFHAPFWQLTGTAVFAESGAPCRLEYQVTCDPSWRTRHAQLTGWFGSRRVVCTISADARHHWRPDGRRRSGGAGRGGPGPALSPAADARHHGRLDGRSCSDVAGCVDLDLSFSPATNLLPIRRLALPVGQAAPVRAAWLRFPEFRLEPLEQRYHRMDTERYRYESGAGTETFRAELRVTPAGFVAEDAGLWSVETPGRRT